MQFRLSTLLLATLLVATSLAIAGAVGLFMAVYVIMLAVCVSQTVPRRLTFVLIVTTFIVSLFAIPLAAELDMAKLPGSAATLNLCLVVWIASLIAFWVHIGRGEPPSE